MRSHGRGRAAIEITTGTAPVGWDDAVASLNGHLFHSGIWAAYQRAHARLLPIFYLTRDEAGGPTAAALGLLRQGRHPVLSRLTRELALTAHPAFGARSHSIARDALAGCEAHARSLGCARLRLDSFGSGQSPIIPADAGYVETPRLEFQVDLTAPLDRLWANVRKDQREKIRRLAREGVTFEEAPTREACQGLRLVREATRAKRAAVGLGYELRADPAFYDDLYEHLVKPSAARLFLAHRDGEVVGGLLFGVFAGRAYSMFSGSTEAGYRLGAQGGLFWTAVETFKAEGFVELNRGGVPASAEHAADPLHGIYLFKLRLGTTPLRCRSGVKVLSRVRDAVLRLRERRWR